jgi:hypothetical protein
MDVDNENRKGATEVSRVEQVSRRRKLAISPDSHLSVLQLLGKDSEHDDLEVDKRRDDPAFGSALAAGNAGF